MIRATDATWPFVCLQSSGKSTQADIDGVMPVFKRVFARGRKHISFSDARQAHYDAAQRKLWADFTNATMVDSARYVAANVIVLDSTLLRGALTALNWLAPPKVPQHVAASIEEAMRIARDVALANDIMVTPQNMADLAAWLENRTSCVAV